MPQRNRTGPAGAGPMTGRGMGLCTGKNTPGWRTGRDRGMQHRGCRWGAAPQSGAVELQEEMDALRMQLIALGQQMAQK